MADRSALTRAAGRLGVSSAFLEQVVNEELGARRDAAALIRRRAGVLAATEPEVSAALNEIADGYATEAPRG